MQIQEAKASLHRYVSNSPLRQQQQQAVENENQPYRHYLNEQAAVRPSENVGRNEARRNYIEENAAAIGGQSRPSTDLEHVHSGYTEFFSWGNDDRG